MAVVVRPNQLVKSSLIRDLDGYTYKATYHVEGLTGDILVTALDAAGIPAYNQEHPNIPYCLAKEYEVTPTSGTSAYVTVTYKSLTFDWGISDLQNSYEGTLVSDTTGVDKTGAPIVLTYDGNPKYPRPVSYLAPRATLVLERYAILTDDQLDNLMNSYLGKVNAVVWHNSAPLTWLCAGIKATPVNHTSRYKMVYTFVKNPNKWIARVRVDPPLQANPQTGNGYGEFEIYPTADFSAI